jgi:hypothetical protein
MSSLRQPLQILESNATSNQLNKREKELTSPDLMRIQQEKLGNSFNSPQESQLESNGYKRGRHSYAYYYSRF